MFFILGVVGEKMDFYQFLVYTQTEKQSFLQPGRSFLKAWFLVTWFVDERTKPHRKGYVCKKRKKKYLRMCGQGLKEETHGLTSSS